MSPIKDIAPPTPINPNVIHNKIRALQQEIALQHVQEKQIVDNQEQLEKIKLPDNNPIEQYQQCQADMTKLQKDINYNQMFQQLYKEQDKLNNCSRLSSPKLLMGHKESNQLLMLQLLTKVESLQILIS